ncbi:hypothetical protein [Methylobacterium planeticum]|uniref:Uncharacterized protein n=1 Tax=Methylobacterium planeticum TaxID=2615211 RepID=A0A6N6MNA7_9HYPH|nr:hypothetical protein [Methylobacterium planeticum]KAB1072322.1 hypothetical protein F6X51_16600 [Methylobacterium planeticum]
MAKILCVPYPDPVDEYPKASPRDEIPTISVYDIRVLAGSNRAASLSADRPKPRSKQRFGEGPPAVHRDERERTSACCLDQCSHRQQDRRGHYPAGLHLAATWDFPVLGRLEPTQNRSPIIGLPESAVSLSANLDHSKPRG